MESNQNNESNKKTNAAYDPGWNDPPLFSFDTVNTTVQTPKKTLLNKRVAFPLTSQQSLPKSSITHTAIPPNNAVPPGAMPNFVPASGHTNKTVINMQDSSGSGQNLQKEEALLKVLQIFEEILTGASEELQKNGVEIRRRLDIMKKMWEEDKLKPEIHTKMVQLSEALSLGNSEQADRIHMGLMVDHVSLCSPWMVGVRQLIHHVKTQSTKVEIQEQYPDRISLTAN